MKVQRGGFALGLVVGLLVGLALALGVALYITKVPVPFVNKVPQRGAEQDQAEAERNKHWNPNAPLAPKGAEPAPTAGADATPATPGRDPAAILSGTPAEPPAGPAVPPVSTIGGPEPFIFFVQIGAYTRNDDAESQRARLAMLGLTARITEREQAGRTVYRVRLGPLDRRADAEALQQRLKDGGIEGQLVRVQRP